MPPASAGAVVVEEIRAGVKELHGCKIVNTEQTLPTHSAAAEFRALEYHSVNSHKPHPFVVTRCSSSDPQL